MKKIIVAYSLLGLAIGFGAWVDRNRKTEGFDVSFDAAKLAEKHAGIEETWKRTHPNAKNVSFAYHTSFDKVDCYWVNYY